MSFVTLDIETYYDDEYSLSKMTTEEYVNDDRFQIIGVGLKPNPDEETLWFSGSLWEIHAFLKRHVNWSDAAVLCHNAHFDGFILSSRMGLTPAMYFDTYCMTRAVNGVDSPASLASLAQRYGVGLKGTEVIQAKGKRREDFTPEQLFCYGAYCRNDCDLTLKVFEKLVENFPEDELSVIDLTIRMYTNPKLQLDDYALVHRLEEIKTQKSALLGALKKELGCEDEEGVRQKLASNKKFAEVLEARGYPVPMKVSPVTAKEIPALAKTDEAFLEMAEEGDALLQQLCAARLGTRSTVEESRIIRFIDMAARNRGNLPVPLKYYGAHTGRWSGMDAINWQNIPTRDIGKRALKNAITAPFGHKVVNADSSQIEARKLAWWAKQDNVTKLFANKEDVYCYDASEVYARPITKADPLERHVGKTMRLGLGYGTGPDKLRRTLATSAMPVELSKPECESLVYAWRNANPKICDLWTQCDLALNDLASWPEGKAWYWLGRDGAALVTPLGIKLPNNLFIKYPNLRKDSNNAWIYDSRKGAQRIWGGTVVENVTQALARIAIVEQMLAIAPRYKPVLTVHDSLVYVIPDPEIADATAFITDKMSTAPAWAPGLPLACEVKVGKSYGEC